MLQLLYFLFVLGDQPLRTLYRCFSSPEFTCPPLNSFLLFHYSASCSIDFIAEFTLLWLGNCAHDKFHSTSFPCAIFFLAVLSEMSPFDIATCHEILFVKTHLDSRVRAVGKVSSLIGGWPQGGSECPQRMLFDLRQFWQTFHQYAFDVCLRSKSAQWTNGWVGRKARSQGILPPGHIFSCDCTNVISLTNIVAAMKSSGVVSIVISYWCEAWGILSTHPNQLSDRRFCESSNWSYRWLSSMKSFWVLEQLQTF